MLYGQNTVTAEQKEAERKEDEEAAQRCLRMCIEMMVRAGEAWDAWQAEEAAKAAAAAAAAAAQANSSASK